ncbi:MAG: polysaccharide biosynthesis tyrosine autokinase [Planctomycetes bacterium]|nr:polysaccharide biosynthesis tyrosine autokinase [Planctomycetota bacterium]
MSQAAEWTPMESPEMDQAGGGLDLLAIAWQRRWIIVCLTVVALGLGYLRFLKATPVYESAAQILIIKQEADLPMAGVDGQVNYEDELSTHMILIQSPLIIEQAVKKHDLASLPSFRGAAKPVGMIIGGLKVERGGDRRRPDPNVFVLEYSGLDAADCEKVLNAIVQSYQDFLGETYQDFSKETVALITKAKDELHRQLTEKEAAYREFREESPLLWKGEDGGNLHEMRMGEIEATRSQVLVDISQTKAQIEAIDTAMKQGGNREALMLLVAMEDSPDSPRSSRSLRTEFEQAMFATLLDEQMMLEDYGADHPKVKAVRKKMQLMREHLGSIPLPKDAEDGPVDFLAVYVESLGHQVKISEERLRTLDEMFEQERDAAKAMASFQVSEETFRSEIARTQQLFDSVVKRVEEMNLMQDYGGVNTQLISPPGIGSLVEPKLPNILGVSAVLGLFAGFGLSYLVELADKRFRSPDDVQRQLGLPLVGHIPLITADLRKESRDDKDDEKVAEGKLSPMLWTHYRPKTRQAEAYRAVRTSLFHSAQGQGHKVIQVTSPNPGDGKTTLASNLAVSVANSGKSVLLVDADCRRPRVHKYFGLDNSVGLTSVIAEEADIPEASQETAVANLWVMTCGPKTQNPADVLTSPRLTQAFDVLKEKYDFVIVDSPPLLAVTDPSVIATRIDAVLLVMRLAKNARHGAHRATEMLRSLGAEILGVVVNGVGKKAGYGYGGYYRYGGYRYGGHQYGRAYGGQYGYGSEPYGGNGSDVYYSDDPDDEQPAGKGSNDVNDQKRAD